MMRTASTLALLWLATMAAPACTDDGASDAGPRADALAGGDAEATRDAAAADGGPHDDAAAGPGDGASVGPDATLGAADGSAPDAAITALDASAFDYCAEEAARDIRCGDTPDPPAECAARERCF